MEHIDAVKLTDRLHAEQGRGDPFAGAVRATRMPMIITDPRQADHPIVFANDAFLALTGYDRQEVLGRNCRFLQGPDTDRNQVGLIRRAIADRTDVSVELLNYRKDGTTFWNALYLSPVFTDSGELHFFFASQFDVTERKARELRAVEDKEFFENAVRERTAELEAALAQKTMLLHEVDHRVKNNLQMVSAMIRNQSRHIEDVGTKNALRTTMVRVETLGTVHRRLYESKDISMFAVEGFVREVGADLLEVAGRPGIKLDLDLEEVIVSSQVASPLALLINEIMTNALKHAFPDEDQEGTIRVTTSMTDDMATMTIEDDGVGRDATQSGRKTFGHQLVESLVRQMRGTIEWSDARPGTRAVLRFPAMTAGLSE